MSVALTVTAAFWIGWIVGRVQGVQKGRKAEREWLEGRKP